MSSEEDEVQTYGDDASFCKTSLSGVSTDADSDSGVKGRVAEAAVQDSGNVEMHAGDKTTPVVVKNKNVDALTFNVGHAHRTKDSLSDRITAQNKLAFIRIDAYDHLAVKGTLVIAAREGEPAENWDFSGMLTPVNPVKKYK